MPDEFTKEQAQAIVSDSTHPDHARLYGPNGDGEGGDPALKARIEAAFAKADPERHHRIKMQYGDQLISPEDLARPRTHEEYVASLDRALANHAALEAEQKAKGQETRTASEGTPGPGYEAAKESFRESLGMDAGQFDGHVQNLHAWVNESFGSVAEFDKLAEMAESALGVKGAAELALKLAGEHVRQRSRR